MHSTEALLIGQQPSFLSRPRPHPAASPYRRVQAVVSGAHALSASARPSASSRSTTAPALKVESETREHPASVQSTKNELYRDCECPSTVPYFCLWSLPSACQGPSRYLAFCVDLCLLICVHPFDCARRPQTCLLSGEHPMAPTRAHSLPASKPPTRRAHALSLPHSLSRALSLSLRTLPLSRVPRCSPALHSPIRSAP
eukprot:3707512-Pleurochrysis_carterae.AAC.2